MVDSKYLISLPPALRLSLMAFLFVLFAASCWTITSSLGKDGFRDWVMVAMSVVQMSATGLVLAAVLFYGEADVNVSALREKTRRWLTSTLPGSLGQITNSNGEILRVVNITGLRDVFGCQYELQPVRTGKDQVSGQGIKLWVGLNVHRLVVIYWAKCDNLADLEGCLEKTFSGAKDVGWAPARFQTEDISGQRICSIWTSWMHGLDGFLKTPEKQLFAAQDIAMMTQSVLRSAERKGVAVCTTESPRPL